MTTRSGAQIWRGQALVPVSNPHGHSARREGAARRPGKLTSAKMHSLRNLR